MSGLTFYEVSIPTFTKGLHTLQAILAKAEAYAKSKGLDADEYAEAALCEGMKPLNFQVQVVSNTVKKAVWRLTGDEIESWDDDEDTMAQLNARIQKTLDLLKTVDPKQLDGKEDDNVEL